MPREYIYIISGRHVKKDGPVFFYEWTVGGGTVVLGWHGTEKEWDAKQILAKKEAEERGRVPDEIQIVTKRELPTSVSWMA